MKSEGAISLFVAAQRYATRNKKSQKYTTVGAALKIAYKQALNDKKMAIQSLRRMD